MPDRPPDRLRSRTSPNSDVRTDDLGQTAVRLTFLLCDDHAVFRDALTLLVEQQPGWHVIAQAGNGGEAIRLAEQLKPDVAVLDIDMPEVSGVQAAQGIRDLSPATVIIALSMYSDAHHRDLMFDAGASAYVLKNQAATELMHAIRAVLRGETYRSPLLGDPAPPEPRRLADQTLARLTAREREVLQMLAQGRRTRDIAEALGISVKTAETYRSRVMDKCGLDNLAGLVKFAIRAGLVRAE